MADAKLTALTELSALALDDQLYAVDVSDTTDDAAGSSRRVLVDRIGGFLNPSICQGRLTLETGVPISTTDQTAKTNIFFAPFNGNRIAIYDGTRWELYAFTQLTLALGTITSGKNYDVFIYDNAGTLTLEMSAAWTNDTTRADALTTQDGITVKSGATTRRYLGTFRTTSTTTTESSIGGTTTQVGGKRFLWNAYNQTPLELKVIDTTDSWAYTTNTIRQAGAVAGNKVEYVTGDATLLAVASVAGTVFLLDNGANAAKIGIGVDSTSTFSGIVQGGFNGNAADGLYAAVGGRYVGRPGLGYHYLSWNEKGGDVTSTFLGDNGADGQQSGLTAIILG